MGIIAKARLFTTHFFSKIMAFFKFRLLWFTDPFHLHRQAI